jgi:hypothetical protein
VSVSVAARSIGTAVPGGRRERRLRRVGALVASLLFHGVIFALLFGSLKGGPVTGGGASGDDTEIHTMTVSLAGLRGAPRQSAATQADDLQALFSKIRSEQTGLAASDTPKRPASDVAKLFDVVEPDSRTIDTAAGGAGSADVDQGGHGAAAGSDTNTQAAKSAKGNGPHKVAGAGSDASAGNLWLQIKPCWSQLPNVSNVQVTLEISLNDRGRIAVPPKIMRESTGAPDQARLIAEARALTAVTACVPYHPAALSGSTRLFRVEFGASDSVAHLGSRQRQKSK